MAIYIRMILIHTVYGAGIRIYLLHISFVDQNPLSSLHLTPGPLCGATRVTSAPRMALAHQNILYSTTTQRRTLILPLRDNRCNRP